MDILGRQPGHGALYKKSVVPSSPHQRSQTSPNHVPFFPFFTQHLPHPQKQQTLSLPHLMWAKDMSVTPMA